MLKPGKTYQEVYEAFEWEIPEFYNIGADICDKWASQRYRVALIYENEDGKVEKYTFWEIRRLSNKLANGLASLGIGRRDRIGILLGQCPETAIAHVSIYKLGAIAIPLFSLFGTDALEYRLSNAKAKGIITDATNLYKIMEIRDRLPHLKVIIVTGGEGGDGTVGFWNLVEKGSPEFDTVKTRAEDPALIIYTSGTTGPPKGALHAHRVLLGHLPGVEFPHNFFPKDSDLFWTPADWAWIGGLIDVLFPSWHHGIPVVAHRARKFDPERAFYLLEKHGIRNAFMPPTALKLMRQVKEPRKRYDFQMRTIGSGGRRLVKNSYNGAKRLWASPLMNFMGRQNVTL